MVSEAPPGAIVEFGRHIVTVGLKRLVSTPQECRTSRFGEEVRSKVVCRFEVAHLHDPSFLPVCFAIDVYLPHSSLIGHFDNPQNCNNFIPLVPNYRVLKSQSCLSLLGHHRPEPSNIDTHALVHFDVRQDC